jgi:hypothetical protein
MSQSKRLAYIVFNREKALAVFLDQDAAKRYLVRYLQNKREFIRLDTDLRLESVPYKPLKLI